jgi:uncharacterized protein YukE
MANPANQMYLRPSAAQQASAVSAQTSGDMFQHKTTLDGAVADVIGSAWIMQQASSFGTAHAKWSAAMQGLIDSLNKLSGDANQHQVAYAANDAAMAGTIGRVPDPVTLGPAMRNW